MSELLIRAAGTLERLDRCTLVGRYLPWDEPADVVDLGPGGAERYREGFRRGAVDRQLHASREVQQFISFVDGHEGGLGKLGMTRVLRDEPDGLYGEIRVLPRALDDVDAMLEEGITGLSVGFVPIAHREADGIRWRTRVALEHVALVPMGAYPSAQIVAWRQAADELEVAEVADSEHRAKVAEVLAARAALVAQFDGYATRLRS